MCCIFMSMLFKKKREREREMGKVNCLCMKFSHKVSKRRKKAGGHCYSRVIFFLFSLNL